MQACSCYGDVIAEANTAALCLQVKKAFLQNGADAITVSQPVLPSCAMGWNQLSAAIWCWCILQGLQGPVRSNCSILVCISCMQQYI